MHLSILVVLVLLRFTSAIDNSQPMEPRNAAIRCLQKTNLTIFLDDIGPYLPTLTKHEHFRYRYLSIVPYVPLLQNVLLDSCVTAYIYDPACKQFEDIAKLDSLQLRIESILEYFMLGLHEDSNITRSLESSVLKTFVTDIESSCFGFNQTRQTVLVFSSSKSENFESLKEIANKKTCSVIMVAFHNPLTNSFLPSWMPIHHLILRQAIHDQSLQANLFSSGMVVASQRSIHDLIKNPNFNRFEYNYRTLLQNHQPSNSTVNTTIYLHIQDLEWSLDFDMTLQFVYILNLKISQIQGASMYWILPGESFNVNLAEKIASILKKLDIKYLKASDTLKGEKQFHIIMHCYQSSWKKDPYLKIKLTSQCKPLVFHNRKVQVCQEELLLEKNLEVIMDFINKEFRIQLKGDEVVSTKDVCPKAEQDIYEFLFMNENDDIFEHCLDEGFL